MASQGNRYNEEFKADIIRLIKEEKHPVSKVAKEFGVNEQTIRNWLKSTEDRKIPGNSRIAELEAQLKAEKRNQLTFSKRWTY